MPTAQIVGIPSSTGIPGGNALLVNGSVRVNGGSDTNPNAANLVVVGGVTAYHALTMISGLSGGFGSTANHQHLFWWVASDTDLARNRHQEIYTSFPTGTAFVSGGPSGSCSGTAALPNEHSIDTTATVTLPTAPEYVGRVKFRFTASPALTVGQVVIVTISSSQVAGIQAATYTGTVMAGPTLVSGNWEVQIDMEGLDPLHWNAANEADTTEFNGNWSIGTLRTPIANKGSLASIAGDVTAINCTFTGSVPATVALGATISLLLKTGTTITGLSIGVLHVCTVQTITGLVVKMRVKNQRVNEWNTIGGSDSSTANWDMFQGARDMNHDIPTGLCHSTFYRGITGLPVAWIFGNGDVNPAATNVCVVGSNIVSQTSNEWLAGTGETNSMSLLSDVLTLGKLKVGRTTGTTISGIRIASATLVGGTVTVADTGITANTVILAVRNESAGTAGWLTTSRIASTSYTVTSSSGTDTSTIHVLLFEP